MPAHTPKLKVRGSCTLDTQRDLGASTYPAAHSQVAGDGEGQGVQPSASSSLTPCYLSEGVRGGRRRAAGRAEATGELPLFNNRSTRSLSLWLQNKVDKVIKRNMAILRESHTQTHTGAEIDFLATDRLENFEFALLTLNLLARAHRLLPHD